MIKSWPQWWERWGREPQEKGRRRGKGVGGKMKLKEDKKRRERGERTKDVEESRKKGQWKLGNMEK